MLAYIPYMDPMGIQHPHLYWSHILTRDPAIRGKKILLPSGDRPCSFLRRTQHLWQYAGSARIAAVGRMALHYDRVMDGYGWLWSVVVIVITEPEQRTKWENQKYVCFLLKNLFSDLPTRSYTSVWKSRKNMRGSTNGGSRKTGWFISWNIPFYKWMIKG